MTIYTPAPSGLLVPSLHDHNAAVLSSTVHGLGAWTPYVPTLGNITKGDGTLVAAYTQIGKFVAVRIKFTFGDTSAMGTNPNFSLPVAMATDSKITTAVATICDYGTNTYLGYCSPFGTEVLYVTCMSVSGSYIIYSVITSSVPFTWAVNDYIALSLYYEAS